MTEKAKIEIATYIMMAAALYFTIEIGLMPALLAGLLVYQMVEFGAQQLGRFGVLPVVGRILLLIVIVVVVVSGVSFGLITLVAQLTAGPENLGVLMRKMADIVETARSHLPRELFDYLPFNVEEWQNTASTWLRENASHLSTVGRDVGIFLTHILIGMIIGGLVAISACPKPKRRPLSEALYDRALALDRAFRRIVFSQIRISTLNTGLTAIFVFVLLPLFHAPLPLGKTLVAITFIAGLLPIVGNLISNTAIILVALSVSPVAAICALAFLVLIHKLEYFVNARIVGGQIRARAWELLIAMLVMESAFGLTGLVAAPIYYAYVKDELSAKGLV